MRVPRSLHRQAYRPGNRFAWRPGWRATGMQPVRSLPVSLYTQPITGIPLTGGQGQAVVAGGAASVTVGPQGLGNIWYPAQVTVSTTTGINDNSTCLVYLGSQGVPVTLLGTIFPGGGGTLGLAIPSMAPGQYLIVQWSGAHNGDTAAVNVIGTMDALST